MSAYEELVERICPIIVAGSERLTCTEAAWNILAEVLRTLETPTPEMREAFLMPRAKAMTHKLALDAIEQDWTAMLRASPLAAPQEKL